MTYSKNDIIRAFVGFRLIFQKQTKLSLDSNFYPVCSYGKQNPQKIAAARHNLKIVTDRIEHRFVPAFLMANAVWNSGKIPFIFDHIDSETIDEMNDVFVRWIKHDAISELKELVKDKPISEITNDLSGQPVILKMLLEDQISIRAALIIHRKYKCLNFEDYDMSTSLLYDQKKNVIDTMMSLQDRSDIAVYFEKCHRSLIK